MHRVDPEQLGCLLREWRRYLPRVGVGRRVADVQLILEVGTGCHSAGHAAPW